MPTPTTVILNSFGSANLIDSIEDASATLMNLT